jgi:ATP phosphoribosyltransferase
VLEKSASVEILKKLDFGHCRLSLAVPRDVNYEGLEYFRNKRIATSYPEIWENKTVFCRFMDIY